MTSLLQINDLTKNYGSCHALQGVNMVIEPGQIMGLLGPNGSGKTTLLKIIAGLMQPVHGTITYPDQAARGIGSRQKISFLPDTMQFPSWMKVSDAFRYYKDLYPDYSEDLAQSMIRLLELSGCMRQKVCKLSKGIQERTALALTLSRETDLYLLDEPLGGIDPVGKSRIIDSILSMQLGKGSILISTHLVKDIEKIFDCVCFISKGRIVYQENCDVIRETTGNTVEQKYLEVFSYADTDEIRV